MFILDVCLPPPTIPNATPSSRGMLVGTSITYTCNDGHAFPDGSQRKVIYCNLLFHWENVPNACEGKSHFQADEEISFSNIEII